MVASGYQGTGKATCNGAPCAYQSTPGWAAFSSGTGQVNATVTATTKAGSTAVDALRAQIQGRALPTKPVV